MDYKPSKIAFSHLKEEQLKSLFAQNSASFFDVKSNGAIFNYIFSYSMKNKHLLLFLCYVSTTVLAQQRVPVFSSKNDSIVYEKTHTALMDLFANRNDTSKIRYLKMDSLMNVTKVVRERSQIGWLYQYKPHTSFTSFDSMMLRKVDKQKITHLSISNFNGRKLPAELFACSHLQKLELVNTHIRKLQKKLNRLPHLASVDIYNNTPRKKLVLGKNSTVRELKIRGNNPEKLPKDYKKFFALDTLDLAKNLLTKFPNITHNHVVKLILTENALTLDDLPTRKNLSLHDLLLGENKITIVPDRIINFPTLTKLNFQSKKITDVSVKLGELTDLEEISFYKNQLRDIPICLFKLKNLHLVDLYYNHIDSVQDDLGRLINLQVLYLSHNKLTHLPASIGELVNLRELYLHHNLISSLPESVINLKHLQVLRINNNLFTHLPNGVLHLSKLNNLDISSNNLNDLPSALGELTTLETLVMEGNPWSDPQEPNDIAEKLRSHGTIVHSGISKRLVTEE